MKLARGMGTRLQQVAPKFVTRTVKTQAERYSPQLMFWKGWYSRYSGWLLDVVMRKAGSRCGCETRRPGPRTSRSSTTCQPATFPLCCIIDQPSIHEPLL